MKPNMFKYVKYESILEVLMLANVDPNSIEFSIEEDTSDVDMKCQQWENKYLTGGDMAFGKGGYHININPERKKWHISLKVTARGAKMPGQKALGFPDTDAIEEGGE